MDNIQKTETYAFLKSRVIDLAGSNFVVPEPGIYDEPVRYYKANEQWAAVIEGLVSWLTEITAWQDTNDDNDYAPQQIMIFLEGTEAMALTKDEVCDAVTCALAKAGQALAAGINSNITVTVDDDGNVVVDTGTSGGGSGSTTQQENRYGQAVFIQARLEEYLTDWNEFYVLYPASAAAAETLLTTKYLLNAGITQATIDYYAHRDGTGDPLPTDLSNISYDLFCEGFNKQVVAGSIIDSLYPDLLLVLQVLDCLTQEQYEQWEQEGTDEFDLNYTSAPCYRFPTVVDTYDSNDFGDNEKQIPQQPSFDDQRTYRVTITGRLTGDTVDYDGMFLVTNDGVPQYNPLILRAWESYVNVNTSASPENEVGYTEAGGYTAQYDVFRGTPNPMALWGYQIPQAVVDDTNLTGSFTITIEDRGTET